MREIPESPVGSVSGAADIVGAFVQSVEPAPDMESVNNAQRKLDEAGIAGIDALERAASLHHGEPESQFRV